MIRALRRVLLGFLAGLVPTLAVVGSIGPAGAYAQTYCPVNASGGFANCLTYGGPGYEQARALHTAGRPYRFQLYRPSDGARWGWWEWNDGDYHVIFLNLAGSTIVAQVDNLGSANPATYDIEMG